MAPAVVIVVVIMVVVGAGLVLAVRALVADESRIEARLHDPNTPTVAYAIPNGVDPVPLIAALKSAGFASVIERVGDAECILVDSGESGREQVRRVIEGVHVSTYDGTEYESGRVVFEDER